MDKPWLLDLFAGAGGAGEGYRRAGFHVVSVDIAPQKHNPHEFYQDDALAVLDTLLARKEWNGYRLHDFDAIHASPPCQHYAAVTRWRGKRETHPDLIAPVRERLMRTGLPWVMENVREAPLRADVLLCGSMFGLRIRRHRHFETSWRAFHLVPSCNHRGLLPFEHKGERAYTDAMGCDWMNNREAREAIPPAYTQWIGAQLLTVIGNTNTARRVPA